MGGGYVGRFAPSPTGALHLGSLYAAAAGYLDARAQGGRWEIRIEDLDVPRVVAGSALSILQTLERFGFEWDGPIVYQSTRTAHYRAALQSLGARGLTFECSCSRAQLAEEERYPGHCRTAPRSPHGPTAVRLRVDEERVEFTDRIQGRFRQDIGRSVGDFILSRRDGLTAYVLAVVIDDADQHVSDIVRGADLLDNTPRQIHLQRLLGVLTPRYAHVPVLTEADGAKLAKSSRTVGVEAAALMPQLIRVFRLLGL
ncbi:MAG: tRNA glutamyl-Q(34) synthetase GluQRS, partial [Pseudomonadota bacterium]|nr:tRNA glutamyl-Q(34) synthetase GluQRS [Pseudomonadota bacterium]